MNIEQNNELIYDHILVRFGELSTKGKNKKDFIKRLLTNVKNALSAYPNLQYERTHDRLYILLNGEDAQAVSEGLRHVFGISSFSLAIKVSSQLEAIVEMSLRIAKQHDGATFKMETRRSDKRFAHRSDDVNRAAAGAILRNTACKVDVKHPQLRIQVEIHEQFTYIMTGRMQGAGGYPVGVGGKALVMLSGGIDSPLAAYLTMKRGVAVECIHYASPPYTSARAQEKVLELARLVARYQGHIRVHIVPFTQLQLAIYEHCDESYAITIMRRMMYRIAHVVAERQHAAALVNGESIGQVASQTLESMAVINAVTTMPILRPVCAMDKVEIIDYARKIGTYETSILPFEDCCTIFTPKNPVTKPTLAKAERQEQRFDFEPLLAQCIEEIEVRDIYPQTEPQEDEEIF